MTFGNRVVTVVNIIIATNSSNKLESLSASLLAAMDLAIQMA
jgi:hypothetical protein